MTDIYLYSIETEESNAQSNITHVREFLNYTCTRLWPWWIGTLVQGPIQPAVFQYSISSKQNVRASKFTGSAAAAAADDDDDDDDDFRLPVR